MAQKDYYAILGVDRKASAGEIKKAFRKLAMEYHPDKHHGDKAIEQKFKEINEAYEVLKDEEKRAAYDRHGSGAFQGGGFSQSGFSQSGFDRNTDFSEFADMFSGFFNEAMGGGQRQRVDAGRGSDLRYDLNITLVEAYTGIKKRISYKTASECESCKGTGSATNSGLVDCLSCRGSGRMRAQQGFFVVETTCNRCAGAGKIVKDPCKPCHGEGRLVRERTLVVTVPAGIENEHRIKLKGEGEAGLRKAESGDLYIFIHVSSHPLFQRRGADLYCKVPVKITTATLGGVIDVPTLSGKAEKVRVDSGTQHGRQLKVKDKGMPILNSKQYGDLLVEIDIEVPVKLTKRQRELLEEFEKESPADSNPRCNGFFSKVKEMWDSFTKE